MCYLLDGSEALQYNRNFLLRNTSQKMANNKQMLMEIPVGYIYILYMEAILTPYKNISELMYLLRYASKPKDLNPMWVGHQEL